MEVSDTKKTSYWIPEKVDYRHRHYVCHNCKGKSKYRKSPFCPMCGLRMVEIYDYEGK